jgi:hypothetical protein
MTSAFDSTPLSTSLFMPVSDYWKEKFDIAGTITLLSQIGIHPTHPPADSFLVPSSHSQTCSE